MIDALHSRRRGVLRGWFKRDRVLAKANLAPIPAAERPHRLSVHAPAPQFLETVDYKLHTNLQLETRDCTVKRLVSVQVLLACQVAEAGPLRLELRPLTPKREEGKANLSSPQISVIVCVLLLSRD